MLPILSINILIFENLNGSTNTLYNFNSCFQLNCFKANSISMKKIRNRKHKIKKENRYDKIHTYVAMFKCASFEKSCWTDCSCVCDK